MEALSREKKQKEAKQTSSPKKAKEYYILQLFHFQFHFLISPYFQVLLNQFIDRKDTNA